MKKILLIIPIFLFLPFPAFAATQSCGSMLTHDSFAYQSPITGSTYAQQVQFPFSCTVQAVRLYVDPNGYPGSGYAIRLQADNAGVPGAVLEQENNVVGSSAGFATTSFSGTVVFRSFTPYWLTVDMYNGGVVMGVAVDSMSLYPYPALSDVNNSGVWSPYSSNLTFDIIGDVPNAYPQGTTPKLDATSSISFFGATGFDYNDFSDWSALVIPMILGVPIILFNGLFAWIFVCVIVVFVIALFYSSLKWFHVIR